MTTPVLETKTKQTRSPHHRKNDVILPEGGRRPQYATDLTDPEWAILQPFFPAAAALGRPRRHSYRSIMDAILYVTKSGGQWRLLPKDLPPWQTVYCYLRRWIKNGLWETISTALRERIRRRVGKNPHPSAAIIDSQSVKTTQVGGEQRGFDAGKLIKGRKRHLLVDTLGLLLAVVVHSAAIQEKEGAKLVLFRAARSCPRLRVIFADGGYAGYLIAWMLSCFRLQLTIVKRSDNAKGFVVLPKRWIVERTFAWLSFHRRLSKDYENRTDVSEAFITIAMIRLMTKRLARQANRNPPERAPSLWSARQHRGPTTVLCVRSLASDQGSMSS